MSRKSKMPSWKQPIYSQLKLKTAGRSTHGDTEVRFLQVTVSVECPVDKCLAVSTGAIVTQQLSYEVLCTIYCNLFLLHNLCEGTFTVNPWPSIFCLSISGDHFNEAATPAVNLWHSDLLLLHSGVLLQPALSGTAVFPRSCPA